MYKLLLATLLVFPTAAYARDAESKVTFAGEVLAHHAAHMGRQRVQVRYYATPWPAGAPLVVIIQGSGCQPVLFQNKGATYSTIFGLVDAVKRRDIGLLVADKPYASVAPGGGGAAKGCSESFNRSFTLDSWSAALASAIDDWRHRAKRRREPVRLLGSSEGAVVSAKLAATNHTVDRVALIGLTGSSQAYDEVLSAYLAQDVPEPRQAELDRIGAEITRIAASPDDDRTLYRGHPYKRWASFFTADPTALLLKSRARHILLVSGTADAAVPIQSTERAWITLLAHGRDVEFARIPGADHGLMSPGDNGMEGLARQLNTVLDWLAAPSGSFGSTQ